MAELSRRAFLSRGARTVGGAFAASVVPGCGEAASDSANPDAGVPNLANAADANASGKERSAMTVIYIDEQMRVAKPSNPFAAATCPIPEPICPNPTIPTFLIISTPCYLKLFFSFSPNANRRCKHWSMKSQTRISTTMPALVHSQYKSSPTPA